MTSKEVYKKLGAPEILKAHSDSNDWELYIFPYHIHGITPAEFIQKAKPILKKFLGTSGYDDFRKDKFILSKKIDVHYFKNPHEIHEKGTIAITHPDMDGVINIHKMPGANINVIHWIGTTSTSPFTHTETF